MPDRQHPAVEPAAGPSTTAGGPSLDDAVALATRAHTGQVDEAGEEYIGHPLRVMGTVARTAPAAGVDPGRAQMAAVLHDVVEDTEVTLADLIAAGYPPEVAAAVDALSHRPGEPVEQYLARVALDPLAVVVKRADMADNSDPRRLGRLPAEQADRLTVRYVGRRRLLDDLVARAERRLLDRRAAVGAGGQGHPAPDRPSPDSGPPAGG